MTNPFFKNTGPYEINDLLKLTSIKNQSISNEKINDIKDLGSSKKGDITFLHSKKYGEHAKSTNAFVDLACSPYFFECKKVMSPFFDEPKSFISFIFSFEIDWFFIDVNFSKSLIS